MRDIKEWLICKPKNNIYLGTDESICSNKLLWLLVRCRAGSVESTSHVSYDTYPEDKKHDQDIGMHELQQGIPRHYGREPKHANVRHETDP
jgi:hypothetical protein